MQFMGHGKNVTDGFAKPVQLSQLSTVISHGQNMPFRQALINLMGKGEEGLADDQNQYSGQAT
jgi:hypothetical protein